jgi:hypothetical protein
LKGGASKGGSGGGGKSGGSKRGGKGGAGKGGSRKSGAGSGGVLNTAASAIGRGAAAVSNLIGGLTGGGTKRRRR